MSTNIVSVTKPTELPIIRIMFTAMVTTLFLMATAIIVATGGSVVVAAITAVLTAVAAFDLIRTITKL